MENWQQDWARAVEAAAGSLEKFFQDASKEVEQVIAPAIDQIETQVSEWLDPFLELGADLGTEVEAFLLELQWMDGVSEFVDPGESVRSQHPICKGCRHFHGEVYNGTPFICAMHPYGIVDGADSCADKEAFSWRLPSSSGHSSDDDV
jgi:hypothetical protein